MSEVVAPGHAKQLSQFRRIVLGELDGGPSSRCERIAETIRNSGAVSEATADIRKILWTKFLFIASYSGLGAVTRVPAGELNAVPEVRQTLELAMREVEALAAAQGCRLDPNVVPVTMEFVANVAPDATSSMQRDIMAGRPSELEAHNGYLTRLAAESGIPAPVHRFIYSVLLPQDRVARRKAGLPV